MLQIICVETRLICGAQLKIEITGDEDPCRLPVRARPINDRFGVSTTARRVECIGVGTDEHELRPIRMRLKVRANGVTPAHRYLFKPRAHFFHQHSLKTICTSLLRDSPAIAPMQERE